MVRAHLFFLAMGLTYAVGAQDLQRGEYFVDVDPGFGNGTSIDVPAGNGSDLSFSADVSALAPGSHVLGIRMLDATGNWGLTNRKRFMVRSMATGGDIVRFEHFVDVDPGFGNGTVVQSNTAPEIMDLLVDVLTTSLTGGTHTVFVRAWSEHGAASITNALPFDVLVGIDELAGLGMTVGPNPMVDALMLHRPTAETTIALDLLDAHGKQVRSGEWTGDHFVLPTNDLVVGSYLLLLRMEGRHPVVLKLVK